MIPLPVPFFALALVCAFCPPPRWLRRVDWLRVAVWSLALGFCLLFWFDVFQFVRWAAS